MGVLYNMNSVRNVFKEGLTQNFVPMKFKELLAEAVQRDFYLLKLCLFVYPLFVQ